MRRLVAVVLFAAACGPGTAVIDGRTVPRLELEYVGQPFAVRHVNAHPRPGGASSGLSDDGGRIIGSVCGLDVNFDVRHEGDHVRLTGFLDDASFDSTITVRDEHNLRRLITGNFSQRGGSIELDLRKNHLTGRVGYRSFTLVRQGDRYVGSVKVGNKTTALAEVDGAAELWTLPPATQGVVLPSLLTCFGGELEDFGRGALIVGFGGRQTFEPKYVSAVYHTNTGEVQRLMMGQPAGPTPGGIPSGLK
jgi:hypothetical protein